MLAAGLAMLGMVMGIGVMMLAVIAVGWVMDWRRGGDAELGVIGMSILGGIVGTALVAAALIRENILP